MHLRQIVRWTAVAAIMAQAALPALAQTPISAPLNPKFLQFLESPYQTQRLAVTSSGARPSGVLPSPIDFSSLKTMMLANQLPQAYPASFDLRTSGKVTPVKDQEYCGSCWAFATYGSLESCLLTGETWDFSEDNLKNLSGFTLPPDGSGDPVCCRGGNTEMPIAYLARWAGPISEADDSYTDLNCSSPSNLTVRKHVQGVTILPGRASSLDNNNIKLALTTMGAISVAYYHASDDTPYYNETTASYYYNGTQNSDHAVTLIGWDDNYSKTNFVTAPPGNGAFLVKNSWGTGWGNQGYYWVSYYDTVFATEDMSVFNGAEPTSNYDHIYQYDTLGWVSNTGFSSTTGWFANVFTAGTNEKVAAASFYNYSPGSTYEVRVYVDPTSGSPLSTGSAAAVKTGTLTYASYSTVRFDTPVAVSAGHKFSIVVKLTTPGYNYPIPVEYPLTGYSDNATASTGQSYISSNGTSWSDYTTSRPNGNVCLKAFTTNAGGGGGGGTVVTPTFSPVAGSYFAAQNVTISCATTGATIRYTVDGSTPTPSSTVYSGPIMVSQSKTIKAIASATGMTDSAVASAQYTITAPTAPTMNGLPPFTKGLSRTVSWSTPSGATEYYLEMALNASFTGATSPGWISTSQRTYSGLVDGRRYYYHVKSRGSSGESPYSSPVFSTQDATAPTSKLNSIASPKLVTTPATVSWSASDTASGIQSVRVMYRFNSGTYTQFGSYPAGTNTASFNWPGGAGTYDFYTLATDSAGNAEVAPTTPDATVVATNAVVTSRKPKADLNGDGHDDIIGLAGDGSVWYTTNLTSWSNPPGLLESLLLGDIDGSGTTDLIGLADDTSIWCSTDKSHWSRVPGGLTQMCVGDLNGDGNADIVGLGADDSIWFTTDKSNWSRIPGLLPTLAIGDFNGDGSDDVAGLDASGSIWYTTNKATWIKINGGLASIAVGDINGDGADDIAGLGADYSVWFTTNKSTWTKVPGGLAKMYIGDLNGDHKDDIVGLGGDDTIWYTTNESTWTQIPGRLPCLVIGDLNGDGSDDIAGMDESGNIWYTTNKSTWTRIPGGLARLYCAR